MSFLNSAYFGNDKKGIICGNINSKSTIASRNHPNDDFKNCNPIVLSKTYSSHQRGIVQLPFSNIHLACSA